MRKSLALSPIPIAVSLAAFAACGDPGDESSDEAAEALTSLEQALFDCNDPGQRLECAAPDDEDKHFVCHATSSSKNPYNKISVPKDSAHVPGASHNANKPADQAPGASAVDVGSGPGLDCDCQPRACEGICTGAPEGTACDDGDPCTGAGSCVGDACGPGELLPNGTTCGDGLVCDSGGECVDEPDVVINEAESSGGVPGDWVELYNAGSSPADVSGWRFLDADDSHTPYVIPAGTVIPAGGYLVLNEAQFGFGLGSNDSARLFDPFGELVDSHAWTSHAVTTYGRCPNGAGGFTTMNSSTKGGANDCSVAVKINEVESSGGVPGDWAELYNAGVITVDLSGWIFKDNDDTHAYVLPPGTTLAAGSYLVLNEATFGFGLGSADSARIFDAQGTLIDAHAWTSHAAITYGRCPNGTGAFANTASATKGTSNSCGGGGPTGADPWPGQNAVVTVDDANVFGQNLSGLFYESGATDVLWAVRNGPSTLYRLVWNGSVWTPDAAAGWGAGKTLLYPDGTGEPDSEDVTKAELSSSAVYVATERDNTPGTVSRLSILRYDTADAGAELVPTHEWNLNADIPAVGPNLGLEAISWVPDSFLVSKGFFDESKGHVYNPAEYPGHGTGLFFVGLEATGQILVYALDHDTGAFGRIATIASGNTTVKALSFDRDVGYLWSICGSSCANDSSVLTIDTNVASPTFGKFTVRRKYARPSTMGNLANEGIAIAPESECVAGKKVFIWTDDGASGGHSLRADSIPCGTFIP